MDIFNKIYCMLFHRKYLVRRHLCDGMSISYTTGRCLLCGRHFGEGQLIHNFQNYDLVMPEENLPLGYIYAK